MNAFTTSIVVAMSLYQLSNVATQGSMNSPKVHAGGIGWKLRRTYLQDTTCTCVTEQGTKVKVRSPVCLAIARDGPAYNPYRAPRQIDSGSTPQLAGVQPLSAPPSGPPSAVIAVGERPMSTFPESVQNRYSGN